MSFLMRTSWPIGRRGRKAYSKSSSMPRRRIRCCQWSRSVVMAGSVVQIKNRATPLQRSMLLRSIRTSLVSPPCFSAQCCKVFKYSQCLNAKRVSVQLGTCAENVALPAFAAAAPTAADSAAAIDRYLLPAGPTAYSSKPAGRCCSFNG